MTVGDQIKQLRIAKGLTQGQLGKLLGYQSNYMITMVERGKKSVPPHRIPALAKALDVYPRLFMQKYEDPQPNSQYKASICGTCDNAYAHRCLWMALKEPEAGITAIGITAYTVHETGYYKNKTYIIHDCPNYKTGGYINEANNA